jgi:hypothetical protein
MRRWLAVAALGAAFLALPAWGQRRGGGVSGGFAGHAGFAAHGPMMGGRGPMIGNRPPALTGIQRGGVHFVMGGFGHPGSSPFFFHHHHRFFGAWPYAGYYGYPYYSYPGYGDDSYSTNSYQDYPSSDYSAAYENGRQQAEIDRLENEVDRLREEREAPQSQPSARQSHPTTQLQPTELIFRDKHTEQVQNYAIVGQTFWILGEQRARKIPLAQLDIPATKKANDDRGVDFQLPD